MLWLGGRLGCAFLWRWRLRSVGGLLVWVIRKEGESESVGDDG